MITGKQTKVIKNNLRRLAKFCFWLGCSLGVLFIADLTISFKRLLGWNFQLEDWALLVLGICMLLLVPKYYIEMKDKELETIYEYYFYPSSRKAVWILLSLGIICIIIFFMN
jgi:hypothetical protein